MGGHCLALNYCLLLPKVLCPCHAEAVTTAHCINSCNHPKTTTSYTHLIVTTVIPWVVVIVTEQIEGVSNLIVSVLSQKLYKI